LKHASPALDTTPGSTAQPDRSRARRQAQQKGIRTSLIKPSCPKESTSSRTSGCSPTRLTSRCCSALAGQRADTTRARQHKSCPSPGCWQSPVNCRRHTVHRSASSLAPAETSQGSGFSGSCDSVPLPGCRNHAAADKPRDLFRPRHVSARHSKPLRASLPSAFARTAHLRISRIGPRRSQRCPSFRTERITFSVEPLPSLSACVVVERAVAFSRD